MYEQKYYTMDEIRKIRFGEESAPTVFTLRQWANVGIRGHKLRRVKLGKQVCTTLEWLDDFLERLSAVPNEPARQPTNAYADIRGFYADQKGYSKK